MADGAVPGHTDVVEERRKTSKRMRSMNSSGKQLNFGDMGGEGEGIIR